MSGWRSRRGTCNLGNRRAAETPPARGNLDRDQEPVRDGTAAAPGGRRGASERCQPVTVGDTAGEAAQPGRTCGRDAER